MAIKIDKDRFKPDEYKIRKVLEIAKDLNNKNQVLNLELIYKTIKKRLKLPRKEILRIIEYLFNNNLLVEGRKNTKETVLLNLYRRKIYNIIIKYNGAHFSFIRKKIFKNYTTNSGQLLWHLNMLLSYDFIKKIKIGNFTIFLPINMSNDIGTLYFFLKDKINKKIFELLKLQNKVKKTEVYKEINENREKVYYRLKVLIKHEIISYSNNENNEVFLVSRFKNIDNNKIEFGEKKILNYE